MKFPFDVRRSIGFLFWLILGLTFACHGESAELRDWLHHPAIVEIPAPSQLYAIGDVHGDAERLSQLLIAAHLIATAPNSPHVVQWTGGRAVLVITGDVIDKYDHALPAIQLLRALQINAVRAGGRVIVTMGNHEAEFLASGGEKKKSVEFVKELTAAGLPVADVAAGKDAMGVGEWIGNLPIGAKVGDWFFCHAGNTSGRSLETLKTELQTQITSQGFGAPILANPNSMLEARMHPRPWWDASDDIKLKDVETKSKIPKEDSPQSEQRLRVMVEALGCHHLVIGHQPGKVTFEDGSVREAGQIVSKFDGLFFMIDTGMSRGVGTGRAAVLDIRDSERSRSVIYSDGTRVHLP